MLAIRPVIIGDAVTFERISGGTRRQFADNADGGLKNLNPHIISCYGGDDCGKVSLKALDLVEYLQAYDLLKAVDYYKGGDGDRNYGDCSPRNKLREFSKNLYLQSEDILNSFYGWKKNHGIICGSALGLAAVVLNDAGAETNYLTGYFGWLWGNGVSTGPQPDYSPVYWMERAHGTGGYSIWGGEDGIEDCFFKGDHAPGAGDVPQSNSSGTAGYAEGPGYGRYMLTAFLPYARAMDNFLPDWNSKNYLHIDKYRNILKWFQEISNPDNSIPTYDNSRLGEGNILGIAGGGFKGTAQGIYNLRGDYILALSGGEVVHKKTYFNEESGNLIMRMSDTSGSKHFIHMLCETGEAVDIEASPIDDTHEDSDFGSFMIGVDHIALAIDPAYMGWGDGRVAQCTNKFIDHNVVGFKTGGDVEEQPDIPLGITNKLESENHSRFTLNYLNGTIGNNISRDVHMYNTNGIVYYILNDHMSAAYDEYTLYWSLNGNGRESENTCEQDAKQQDA